MADTHHPVPKIPGGHLHSLNLIIALVAGLVSIVGGIYSLKMNVLTPKTGSLQGIIRDEAIAKPLWLTPVEISEPGGAIIATIDTNKDGRYTLDPLKAGDYIIKVRAPRHKAQEKNVKIYAAMSATVNFDLVPEEEQQIPPVTETFSAPRVVAAPSYVPTPAPAYSQAPVPMYSQAPASAYDNQDQQRSFPDGMGPRRPRRPPYHRGTSGGFPSSSTDSSNTDSSSGSSGDLLTQTVGQLIQDWAGKK